MKFRNKGEVFKLMDSNGRRKDVINALNGYLSILDEMESKGDFLWKPIKSREENSLTQYKFYERALNISQDVFKKHDKYDYVVEQLKANPELEKAIEANDLKWLSDHISEYPDILKEIDISIEARARFYTDTLVNLGFANQERFITPVGRALLGQIPVEKDKLESLFPLRDINIIYLRQLLKLRIFSDDGERYYSPFNLAIFALLKRHRLSENEFSELVQGLSPYSDFSDIEQYVLNYREGDIVSGVSIDIPAEIHTNERVSETVFRDNYKNRKCRFKIKKIYD